MAILPTRDRLQVNYKNPQVVDGSLYAIREEQFTYEWFLREAGNWSLVSSSFAFKPVRAPTIKLLWMNWAPVGIQVEMSNYWDENLARLTINYWWRAAIGQIDWRVELAALGVKLWVNTVFAGLFSGDVVQTLIDMSILLNVQQEVRDIYIFKWTPGEGDNTLTTIPSLERILQEEQASVGII